MTLSAFSRIAAAACLASLAFAVSALAAPASHAAAQATPTAVAFRVTNPIRVDGQLEERDWREAPPIGPLLQREPREGAEPSEATEIRVLYDEDTLYVGVVCRDRTPSAIVSTQLLRDADLESDDSIFVVLDPFFDHRNGFFFQVNPSGARADGQVANNAEHWNRDWDGIWDAAARITEEGWVAEIAIPFKTLRFKPGQSVWGLNVERRLKRHNETDRWASARQDIWITNLSAAGRLEGLEGIRQGRGLDIRPYASGGEESSDGKFTGGIDIFKNLTPNLNASLTVNTDFAETEADIRQVNLTRFPLFYPEKRSFFLEGAGIFEMAGAGTGFMHAPDVLPFFSRRIGLIEQETAEGEEENAQVPILAGTKVVGRQGDYNIGFLDVQTRDLGDNPVTGQNLLVARVSRNLFRESFVGGIVTNGNPQGTGRNTLVGADARFATSNFHGSGKNLSLSLYLLRTDDRAANAGDYAMGANIDYPNDLWDMSLTWKQIGESFNPALGFVPRTGIRKASTGISYKPRPDKWGIRQFYFELRPQYITNLHNRVENWRVFTAPLNIHTDSGERVELNYTPEFERLEEPFEIYTGVIIPTGSYQWTRWSAQVETANKRPWVVRLETSWGGFYDGTRRQLQLQLTLKPSTHVMLSLQAERNDISLVEGTFFTQLLTVRGDYNFSPDVSWANLVQYDNESRIFGVQSRFRWILKPGSDLFVVLNRGWYRERDGRYLLNFDKGSVKLQYTFRL